MAPVELTPEVEAKPKHNLTRWFIVGYLSLVLVALWLSVQVIQNRSSSRDRILVQACEQTNVSRRNTYEAFMTLAVFSVQAREDQSRPVSPLVTNYVEYLNEAFDPISCDVDDPLFGIDPTPPDSLPDNQLFADNPWEDQ